MARHWRRLIVTFASLAISIPASVHATQLLGEIIIDWRCGTPTDTFICPIQRPDGSFESFDFRVASGYGNGGNWDDATLAAWEMVISSNDNGVTLVAKKNNADDYARLDFDRLVEYFTNADRGVAPYGFGGAGIGEIVISEYTFLDFFNAGGSAEAERYIWTPEYENSNRFSGDRYIAPFNVYDFEGYEIERFTFAIDQLQFTDFFVGGRQFWGAGGLFTLGVWGKLKPLPEPGTLTLLSLGLLGLGFTARRRQH